MKTAEAELAEPVALWQRVTQAWGNVGTGARTAWLAAGVMAMVVGAGSAEPAPTTITGAALACAALVDVHERRLPNALVAVAALATVWGAAVSASLASAAVGAAIGGGLLLVVRLQRGLGMGDVKVGAVVGGAAGTRAVVIAPVAIAVVAALAAAWGLLSRRRQLPLGPALWIGWLVAATVPEGWWR